MIEAPENEFVLHLAKLAKAFGWSLELLNFIPPRLARRRKRRRNDAKQTGASAQTAGR